MVLLKPSDVGKVAGCVQHEHGIPKHNRQSPCPLMITTCAVWFCQRNLYQDMQAVAGPRPTACTKRSRPTTCAPSSRE